MEHVKTHSSSSAGGVSAPDRTEGNRIAEESSTVKKFQVKESSPNITVMNHTLNRPVFHRYDFIPSKYQPLIAPTVYHDMAVGNWMRPHNYYLPLRPKEHATPPRRRESTSNTTRHQPISPRHQPISPRHQPISADVSTTNPILSQSNMESYRNDTEPCLKDTELSENRLVSPRGQTEYHRLSRETSNPVSSENSTNKSRPPSITTGEEYSQSNPKDFTDEFSSTSFAAYRAIALSRSSYRLPHGLEREERTSQHQSSRHEPISSRHDSTSSRNDSTSSRNDSVSSRNDSTSSRHDSISSRHDSTNADVSHRPLVTTRAGEVYNGNESVVNSEDRRRYSDDVRKQNDASRWSSDQTGTTLREVPRYSNGVRITPERNPRNSDDIKMANENDQVDLKRRQDNLTTSQNDSHRKKNESHVKRKYTCLNCREEFYHEKSLIEHVCDIFSAILYSCLVCEDDFEKYEDLQEHMRKHWKQVVCFKCTLCGVGLRSEELLKEHNLKHIQDDQDERNRSGESEENRRCRSANDKAQHDPSDFLMTTRGLPKSMASPVICSVNGNVVTKGTSLERDCSGSNTNTNLSPKTELTNESVCSVSSDVNPVSYIPYYEARKQASGYVNVFGQNQAMVVSTIHAAMETSGRYHVPNGLLYAPTMNRSGCAVEHH